MKAIPNTSPVLKKDIRSDYAEEAVEVFPGTQAKLLYTTTGLTAYGNIVSGHAADKESMATPFIK